VHLTGLHGIHVKHPFFRGLPCLILKENFTVTTSRELHSMIDSINGHTILPILYLFLELHRTSQRTSQSQSNKKENKRILENPAINHANQSVNQ